MKKTTEVRVGDRTLQLSNLDKVLYPKTGFTKGQVIDYYVRISETILTYAARRPLTLKRYPEGADGGFFYEKQCPTYRPKWLSTSDVRHTGRDGKLVHYCVLSDAASLAWVANLASIELHVLLSTVEHPDRPTAMVFDLDPGPGRNLLDCSWAALELRNVIASLGLQCFPKSSGKKGMHVYVPISGKVTFEQTKPFAHAVALLFERRYPNRIVSKMQKDLRRDKIFIDWSQNDDHKTTVVAYSLRAADKPFVSTPLEWDEVERAVRRKDASELVVTAEEMLKRVKTRGDLFRPVIEIRQKLPDAADLSRLEQQPRPKKGRLKEYAAKRDFEKTPEPSGEETRPAAAGHPEFVIQKHDASHLHYDFRLESSGVLKSWAVPKGLSTSPKIKRLAVQTEDHPMSYSGFEGVIPEGEYGGGTVMVWDRGSFVNVTEKNGKLIPLEQGLAKGHVDVWLKGKKLNGAWSLIRIGGPRQWIVRKKADAGASDAEPVKKAPDSALSGRSLQEIARDRGSRVWHSNR